MYVVSARLVGSTLTFIGFVTGAANASTGTPWYQSWAPMIVSLTGVGALFYSIYRDQRDDHERRSKRRRR